MENPREIYHKREFLFEREIKTLEQSDISKQNKELIKAWLQHLLSTSASEQRAAKVALQLRLFCLRLKKDLNNVNKADMEYIIAKYNNDNRISEATKADYRRVVKQFYKWYIEEDIRLNNPDSKIDELTLYKIVQGDISKAEVKRIMERKRKADIQKLEAEKFYKYVQELKRAYKLTEIDPAEVITEEDVNILCDKGCRTIKEKAFIWLLHETGSRVGEFLNIKLKDLNIKRDFMEVNLDGKTGKRTVYCYNSLPFLLKYLEVHQDKDNINSFLWLSDNNRNRGARLKHIGGVRILERVFRRSNITKKHNLHWFRHSRATILANKITEPQLRKYMGWSKGSQMIKHYGHLCNKDIQDVILNLHGLREEEQTEKPIKCICGTINPIHERYCYKCMRPLKLETMMQDQELLQTETSKTIQVMLEFMKDPNKMKAFEKFKKEAN